MSKTLAELKGSIQAYRYEKHHMIVYWEIFGPNLDAGVKKKIVEIINEFAIQMMNWKKKICCLIFSGFFL